MTWALQLNLTCSINWILHGGLGIVIQFEGSRSTILPITTAVDEALDPAIRDRLLSDQLFLFDTPWTHILTDVVPLERFEAIGSWDSARDLRREVADNGTVSLHRANGRSARIFLADQLSREGIIHVVDELLCFYL